MGWGMRLRHVGSVLLFSVILSYFVSVYFFFSSFRFIYEELQLSPWHLSGEFIDVHKRAQGTAMMKLTGIGDPSGLGEAYNFLREMDNKPNKAVTNNDGALNAQIKKITGTENDLRKLTMKQMASLLRSYGMKDKQIAVLKRWDRYVDLDRLAFFILLYSGFTDMLLIFPVPSQQSARDS